MSSFLRRFVSLIQAFFELEPPDERKKLAKVDLVFSSRAFSRGGGTADLSVSLGPCLLSSLAGSAFLGLNYSSQRVHAASSVWRPTAVSVAHLGRPV